MKTYFTTLALILAYLADTTITWRPFSVSFGRLYLVVGIILIMCGCICLKAHWYEEGLKRGAEIKKEVIEEIKGQQTIKESI